MSSLDYLENIIKETKLLMESVNCENSQALYVIKSELDCFWKIEDDCFVYVNEIKEKIIDKTSDGYHFFNSLFYRKNVYQGEDLTMIICENNKNKRILFLNNSKRIKDPIVRNILF